MTTSGAYYVGDAGVMSIEVGAASNVTLQGSNAEGFATALVAADWSNISVIAAAGTSNVVVGPRWVRAFRGSSTNTVRLAQVVRE